ncbi:MAG: ATP-binding protein, partial [Thermoanaerobaculia bacterium]
TLRVDTEGGGERIVATNFLLETIFRNLWDNSRQAVDGRCVITVSIHADRDVVTVRVIDNGPGLTAEDAERAFRLQYSSTHRPGRGHMEVNEAVLRLGGTATVQDVSGAGYRVVMSFPCSKS